MISNQVMSENSNLTEPAQVPPELGPPRRFSLKSLFVTFVLVSLLLTAAVQINQWVDSRPGRLVADSSWPNEIKDVNEKLGADKLKNLQVWQLYGDGWFDMNYVWRAKASPQAIKYLQDFASMNPVQLSKIPAEFWKMPRNLSEMPSWWDPRPVEGVEFYKSPTFIPFSVGNGNIDCVAMYDPITQMLYVWSQFDF